MKRRFPASLFAVLVLEAFILIVYAYAMVADPMNKQPMHYLKICNNANMTLTRRWGGSLILFNNEYPYLRSITYGIADVNGPGTKTFYSLRENRSDFIGISYSSFQESTKAKPWWSVVVSLWYPICVFVILSAILISRKGLSKKKMHAKS